MSEYTQRPWSVCKVDNLDEYDVIDAQGYPVALNLRKDVAHLIASAPDLLAERDRLRELVGTALQVIPQRYEDLPPVKKSRVIRDVKAVLEALQEAKGGE